MTSFSRLARGVALGALAASVAGCGTNIGGVRTATLGNKVPVTEAFITPPPGGPEVVTVLEDRFSNGIAQDIILENNSSVQGQNVLYVKAFGPMGREGGRRELERDIPDRATIRHEMAERFPGIAMEISGLYVQNRYGPFSYALGGTRGGTTCLYAWQRIANEGKIFRLKSGAITWRLRLCDPSTSARDLLLLAYGLTINGYFMSKSWDPYGEPPELDPRIGKPGETILPEQAVDPTVVPPNAFGGEPERPVRRRARSTPVSVSRQTTQSAARGVDEPPNDPLPGAAVVPRPEATRLNDPRLETSNLPENAPRPNRRLRVPGPSSAPSVPRPRRDAPSVEAPSVQAPRVISPQAARNGAPSVRVVEMN